MTLKLLGKYGEASQGLWVSKCQRPLWERALCELSSATRLRSCPRQLSRERKIKIKDRRLRQLLQSPARLRSCPRPLSRERRIKIKDRRLRQLLQSPAGLRSCPRPLSRERKIKIKDRRLRQLLQSPAGRCDVSLNPLATGSRCGLAIHAPSPDCARSSSTYTAPGPPWRLGRRGRSKVGSGRLPQADGETDDLAVVVHLQRLGCLAQALGENPGAGLVGVRQHHAELFSAIPPGDIGVAHMLAQ